FSGVLNSTTNVVLTEVEKGLSFEEAIRRAQALGVAETDPSNDLDGWDAAVKVVALTTVLMGIPVRLDQVQRSGLRDLSAEKIRTVCPPGRRYKHVCCTHVSVGGCRSCLGPEFLFARYTRALLQG